MYRSLHCSVLLFTLLVGLISSSIADTKVKVEARVFNNDERAAITAFYKQRAEEQRVYEEYHSDGDKKKNKKDKLPPGLQKKAERGQALPPGWQKKMQKGQIIDSQVYAACEPLAPHLSAQLPAGPVGTITVHVEGRIVRLLEATREIVDILEL